jgi:transketolase
MNSQPANLDQLCIDTLRFLSVDAVQKAESGHPGLPLGAAPMAYALWDGFLRHNPADPHWPDRDRFVLSAGHGSALLYSLFHMTGYDLTLDDLKAFRQWGSKTPGHPERGHTPGVEVTTGPLGQGFANAVGLAMAEAQLAARYNRPDHKMINHRTFVLVGDGDLMEGVSNEAASLAGHLRLGKLICLYDDNRVTLAAGTPITFTEDRAARFQALGWHVIAVEDGNDLYAIRKTIEVALAQVDQPSLILVHTHIGYGSPEQDSFKAHGSPLGQKGVAATKAKLGWDWDEPFYVPGVARAHMRKAVDRGRVWQAEWQQRMDQFLAVDPQSARQLAQVLAGDLPADWDALIPEFAPDPKGTSTRKAGGKIINAIAARVPMLSGGSADLDPSTYTALTGLGDFNLPPGMATDEQGSDGGGWTMQGRNVHFGVREHAMGAIANGMAAHGGVLPFTATFLVFSDYMRPPMRLAALSGLQVVNVFTHDSLAVGEDGPTHQPVEQLANLRAVPNLVVIRPADANETAAAWRVAVTRREGPTALILSRQDLPVLDRAALGPAADLRKGGYVLREATGGPPDLILIASGSEVSLALAAADLLTGQGVAVRTVSMPSWELFEAQPQSYREAVLPPLVHERLAIEAGVTLGWDRYVGPRGAVLGIERFGASAPGPVVMAHYGFTVENVVKLAKALLERRPVKG